MPALRTLDQLEREGRDVYPILDHMLAHLPPGEVVPLHCLWRQERDGSWTLIAPSGAHYGVGRGCAWRWRVTPDDRTEYTAFEGGRVVERVTFEEGE